MVWAARAPARWSMRLTRRTPYLPATVNWPWPTRAPTPIDSQFFITTGPQRSLDGSYTIFGQLVRGFDVQHNILQTPLGPGNSVDSPTLTRPVTPVTNYVGNDCERHDGCGAEVVRARRGQTAHVTVHVDDGHGNTADRVITVTGNTPPTLTSVSTLTGGNRNVVFSTDYATLLAASNLADVDGAPPVAHLAFLITGVSPGTTLKINGVAVTQGGMTIARATPRRGRRRPASGGTLPAFLVPGRMGLHLRGAMCR